jgi:thiamine-monophosphate kinase
MPHQSRHRHGDRILVTGPLGGASAAIAMYEASLPTQLQRFRLLLERLTSPIPRFDVASALAPMMVVHAAIDISDGLLQDAGHVAKASGVRMELQAAALPVDKQLLDCATLLDANPLHWAAAGGEDFELLLTTPPEQVPQMQAAVAEIGVSLTDIGEVVEGEGVVLLDEADEQLHVPTHGWDHLRN